MAPVHFAATPSAIRHPAFEFMKTIKKIATLNFKRFKKLELEFDDKLNILIGDNEAGKSSVLLALDLVLSGSRSKIETIGLETLFNNEVVSAFLTGANKIDELPSLFVEIYLSEQNDPFLNGKNHSNGNSCLRRFAAHLRTHRRLQQTDQ